MANRFCVWIGDELYPVNKADDIVFFNTGKPKKVGDTAEVTLKQDIVVDLLNPIIPITNRRTVILLKSKGMVKDTTYLCDTENNEAWPFEI